jgi:DNA replication licensing factor MCM3
VVLDFDVFRQRAGFGEESEEEVHTQSSERTADETMEVDITPSITDNRLTQFKTSLQRAFRDNRAQSLSLVRVRDSVNTDNVEPFTQGEIRAAIDQMTEENQVMMADGIVFLI